MKYTKKPQGTKPLYGPEVKKPTATYGNQANMQTVKEDLAKITKSGPEGVEITAPDGIKTTLPPEKAVALTPDPQKQGEFDLNPAAINPTQDSSSMGSNGPQVGANVDMKTTEDGSESTAPVADAFTDALNSSQDLTPEQKQQIASMIVQDGNGDIDASETFANMAEQMSDMLPQIADSLVEMGQKMQAALASPEFQQLSPEEQANAKKDVAEFVQMAAKTKHEISMQAPQMKDQARQLRGVKSNPGYSNPLQGVKAPQGSTAPMSESDKVLLGKMLSIAGLR